MLSLGQLYTNDTNDDATIDTNDDDNNTQWTNHNCIGSLAYMPNEPKTGSIKYNSYYYLYLITMFNKFYFDW